MQTEVFEAFRAIDIPEDKALKAAAALSKAMTMWLRLTRYRRTQMDDGLCACLLGGDFRQAVLALTKSAEFGHKRRMFRALFANAPEPTGRATGG
jgi:uncharacterized protein HemY